MRDNPYEIYTITDDVAVVIEAIVLNTLDAATVGLKFGVTYKEAICHFRVQLDGDAYKKWVTASHTRYFGTTPETGRWSGAIVELAISDPC